MVERRGKVVLFPNLFMIGMYEVAQQAAGACNHDVTVTVGQNTVTFRDFKSKEEAVEWIKETFKGEKPEEVPPAPKSKYGRK